MSTPEPVALDAGANDPVHGVFSVFPPELEREIFLLTARMSPRRISIRLMLVASHVRDWIEPYVYKTILLRGAEHAVQFLTALERHHPVGFAASRVRALCLRPSIPLSLTIQLLGVCTGLERLALWILPRHDTARLSELVASLPLTYLSLNLMSILPPNHPKFALQHHPALVNVTHLDIVNHWVLWRPSLRIEHLPCLTHLSFRFQSRGSAHAALATILGQSPRLEVLALLADTAAILGARGYLERQDIRDMRVVVLIHVRDMDDWEAIEKDGVTVWQRADRIVRWRLLNRTGPFDFPPGFTLGTTDAISQSIM